MFEHVENPLRALVSIGRVLRPGAVAVLALPEKRYTFDKRRTVTPFEHLMRDYREGPESSRMAHYVDWVTNVERVEPAKIAERARTIQAMGMRIHFHVWDRAAMAAMFSNATAFPEIPLSVCHCRPCRGETIWVLRATGHL